MRSLGRLFLASSTLALGSALAPASGADEAEPKATRSSPAAPSSEQPPVPSAVAEQIATLQSQLRDAQAALGAQASDLATTRAALGKARLALTQAQADLKSVAEERDRLAEWATSTTTDAKRNGSTLAEMQTTLATRTHELEAARTELANLQKQVAGSADPRKTQEQLAHDLVAAREEIESLTAQLRTANTSAQNSVAATAEAANLRVQLGAMDRIREDLAMAKRQLATAIGERDTARQQLAAAESNVAAKSSETQAPGSDAALAAATSTAERATAELATSRRERDEQRETIARLTAEHTELERRLGAAEKTANEPASLGTQNTQDAERSQQLIRQLTKEKEELEQRTQSAEERSRKIEAELKTAQQALASVAATTPTAVTSNDARVDQIAEKPPASPMAQTATPPSRATPAPASAASNAQTKAAPMTSTAVSSDRGAPTSPTRPGTRQATAKPVTEPAPAMREHVIMPGETLSGIAQHYYGNARRWREILDANRAVLPDERRLTVGQVIKIP